MGIANPIDFNDSNANPQTVIDPNTNTLATKKLYYLMKNSKMAVQDFVDTSVLYPSQMPSETLSSVPQMSNTTVSLNGILKLLENPNPHKAAGPDQLNPLSFKDSVT